MNWLQILFKDQQLNSRTIQVHYMYKYATYEQLRTDLECQMLANYI